MKFNEALCLQGGAMRSVFTDGVLDCLIDNNIDILNVFGISAASKDMVYYPLHQKLFAYKANVSAMSDPNVYNMSNVLLGKSVFDREYFVTNIRDKEFPYNISDIVNSDFNLYIGATNINTGKIEYFDKNFSPLDDAITASCSVPVLFPTVKINNNEYLDGGICENIPFQEAIRRGFKKIIVVTTREKGYRDKINKEDPKDFFFKMKYRNYPKLLSLLENLETNYNNEMDLLDKLEEEGKVFVIRPTSTNSFDRFEQNLEKLSNLYNDGYNTCQRNIEKLFNYLK